MTRRRRISFLIVVALMHLVNDGCLINIFLYGHSDESVEKIDSAIRKRSASTAFRSSSLSRPLSLFSLSTTSLSPA